MAERLVLRLVNRTLRSVADVPGIVVLSMAPTVAGGEPVFVIDNTREELASGSYSLREATSAHLPTNQTPIELEELVEACESDAEMVALLGYVCASVEQQTAWVLESGSLAFEPLVALARFGIRVRDAVLAHA